MSILDDIRHIDVFKSYGFNKKNRVDIIGAGATGSRIVIALAKLGVENIHVWDFDKIESHNIPNQAFGIGDVGKFKVEALAKIVKELSGLEITTHNERVDGSQKLGEVVFVLTDTMASRKEIWNKALKYKLKTKFVIETRMGADNGRIYAINPNNRTHIKKYEETFYSDDEAAVSACGAPITVGSTAEVISGLAVWQLIRWWNIEEGEDDTLDNEIIFSLKPMMTLSQTY